MESSSKRNKISYTDRAWYHIIKTTISDKRQAEAKMQMECVVSFTIKDCLDTRINGDQKTGIFNSDRFKF